MGEQGETGRGNSGTGGGASGRAGGGNARKTGGGWNGARFVDGGLSGIIGIIGQPGTGKSFLMGKMLAGVRRGIVIDTVHQYGTGMRQNPLPGYTYLREPGELVNYWRKYRAGNFRICYQPGYNAAEHFDAVARLTLEVRDTVFAVDEIWTYVKPAWMPAPLEFMARAGRHRGITLIYTGQRPALIAGDLRSVTNQWRVFRMQNELDIAAMRGLIPAPFLSQVPQLADRCHIWRDEYYNCRIIKP
jgi:hypothetical protein